MRRSDFQPIPKQTQFKIVEPEHAIRIAHQRSKIEDQLRALPSKSVGNRRIGILQNCQCR